MLGSMKERADKIASADLAQHHRPRIRFEFTAGHVDIRRTVLSEFHFLRGGRQEVQNHKDNPHGFKVWYTFIHRLIYFFKKNGLKIEFPDFSQSQEFSFLGSIVRKMECQYPVKGDLDRKSTRLNSSH